MIDIILPGYSDKNKFWLEETAKNLVSENEVRTVYWNHWTDFHKKFDPKDKAIDVVDVMLDDSSNIIAKSVGTLVAAYILERAPEKIKKVILCGLPLKDFSEADKKVVQESLAKINPENIICIQNSNDPHASYQEALEFVGKVNSKIKVISKESSDHEYLYADDFTNFLQEK